MIAVTQHGVRAAILTGSLLGTAAASGASAQDLIIVPEAIVAPDGTLVPNRAVVIRNGAIAAIEDADRYADRDDVARRPDAVLSPGLIDIVSQIGVHGSNVERVQPIDPALTASHIVDRADPAFRAAIEAGITTVLVHPGANNLVAGTTAVWRTGSPDNGVELLAEQGPLLVSLGSNTLSLDRAPSSRAGALAMLRSAFSDARAGRGSDRLQSAISQNLPILFRAEAGADVAAGLRLFDQYGLNPPVIHTAELHEIADVLAEGDRTVVVGPFAVSAPPHVLRAPGALSDRGVTIVFAGDMPARGANVLRESASLAVRYGLDAAGARQAMTLAAARVAGQADRIGAIEPGRDADLVLFSDDPLRLDARVLEVYLRGERVLAIKAGEEKPWAVDETEESEASTTETSEGDSVESID